MGQQVEKATEYPMIVVVDESTDYRYMRAVGKKGPRRRQGDGVVGERHQ